MAELLYHINKFALEFIHEGTAHNKKECDTAPEIQCQGRVLPEGPAVKNTVPVAGDDIIYRIELHAYIEKSMKGKGIGKLALPDDRRKVHQHTHEGSDKFAHVPP